MKWDKVDDWHARNGEWTMTWAPNVPLPFGLYRQSQSHGFFKTRQEAFNHWRAINENQSEEVAP